MSKPLSDEELEELKSLLTTKHRVTVYVALMGSIAALISAVGSSLAAVIIALKDKG